MEPEKKFDLKEYKRNWARNKRATDEDYADRQRDVCRKNYQERKDDPTFIEENKKRAKDWSNTKRGKYSILRRHAQRSGREFNITEEQFNMMSEDNCHYCHQRKGFGLDRTNNDVGYIIGNVVPCCWPCNRLKKKQDYDDFMKLFT